MDKKRNCEQEIDEENRYEGFMGKTTFIHENQLREKRKRKMNVGNSNPLITAT